VASPPSMTVSSINADKPVSYRLTPKHSFNQAKRQLAAVAPTSRAPNEVLSEMIQLGSRKRRSMCRG
jgi:hypothetical protein